MAEYLDLDDLLEIARLILTADSGVVWSRIRESLRVLDELGLLTNLGVIRVTGGRRASRSAGRRPR
jgi:hypothetical protein